MTGGLPAQRLLFLIIYAGTCINYIVRKGALQALFFEVWRFWGEGQKSTAVCLTMKIM